MGYPPRQYHEGYWYHVYSRSPESRVMFESTDHKATFLEELDRRLIRHDHTLGAFCLMDTHYHALIRMGPVELDQALQALHMTHAKHLNKDEDGRGQVFEDRPGADIVLDDSYLLQLVPYIHKNPVEAGMVSEASEYEWSSDDLFRTGTWEGPSLDSWGFPPHFQGTDRSIRFEERMGEEIDDWPSGEYYIGTDEELEDLERRKDEREGGKYQERRGRRSKDEIAEEVARNKEVPVEAMKEKGRRKKPTNARQEAMVRMYREGYGPTEIGRYFNRRKGTVWWAVKQAEDE